MTTTEAAGIDGIVKDPKSITADTHRNFVARLAKELTDQTGLRTDVSDTYIDDTYLGDYFYNAAQIITSRPRTLLGRLFPSVDVVGMIDIPMLWAKDMRKGKPHFSTEWELYAKKGYLETLHRYAADLTRRFRVAVLTRQKPIPYMIETA